MPHVSKKQLSKKVLDKLSTNLLNCVIKANNKLSAAKLLKSILSPTEIKMIAKRIAMILMIDRRIKLPHIQKSLKVSSSTTARIYKNYEIGKYAFITETMRNKNYLKMIESIIKSFHKVSMPPIVGKGRWKFLNEMYK